MKIVIDGHVIEGDAEAVRIAIEVLLARKPRSSVMSDPPRMGTTLDWSVPVYRHGYVLA